jgi:hypothetical protein
MKNNRDTNVGHREVGMRLRVSAEAVERSDRWLENWPEEREGWPVCKKYDLHRGAIVARFTPEDLTQWVISWPLEEAPDLYLRFARLHEEPDFERAALTFAHEHGLPDGTTIVSPFTGFERPFPDRMDLSRLFNASRRAWFVLALYESVLNHDVEQAKALIAEFERDRTFRITFGLYFRPYRMEQASLTHFPPELVLALEAAVLVAKSVSDELCSAQIDFSLDDAVELDPSCIRTYWGFDNLIGVMHLQMYWLMKSGGRLARCDSCGRMIALSHTDPRGRKRRRDRRFCDDACRQAHHRSKKRSLDGPS